MTYPKVRPPRKITKKWLDQVFAPLMDYLERTYPDEKNEMLQYMSFMTNEEGRFYYRNDRTKGYIIFDQAGNLISCDPEALRYKFDDPEVVRVVRPPREERYIHPNVTRWMYKHLDRSQERTYGEEISIFLQEFWGPIVNYQFDDLKVGYPLPGKRAPYCLYLYHTKHEKLVAIQFVRDEVITGMYVSKQYRLYQKREFELMAAGWKVVKIIRELLDEEPEFLHDHLRKIVEQAAFRDPVYKLKAGAWRILDKKADDDD